MYQKTNSSHNYHKYLCIISTFICFSDYGWYLLLLLATSQLPESMEEESMYSNNSET